MSFPITASQLHSHLACPHRVAMDAVGDPGARDVASPVMQLLWEGGVTHEHAVVAALDQPCLDLSALHGDEKEAATREAVANGEPLIYSGRLSVHGLLGEPDLLRREQDGYVAIDIKSGAGHEGADGDDAGLRRGYGVQLALYTDILEHMGLAAGRHGYIWDVHGTQVRYDLGQPPGPRSPCLWEIYLKTRQAVRETLARPAASRPAMGSVCKRCVWRSACHRQLRQARDLTLLPGLGRAARDALQEEFPGIEALAAADPAHYIDGERTSFPCISAAALRRFQRRAVLAAAPEQGPYLTQPVDWPQAPVEIFLDIETDPMRGLCYLHGLLIRERDGAGAARERFEGFFVPEPDTDSEREAFAAAMALFRRNPGALVLHYSRYARTEYGRLASRYPEVASPGEIDTLFARPRALDLCLDVVKPCSEWPAHDFSIESLATFCGFQRRDADPSGASSIEWFDQWTQRREPLLRQRLLHYNEDDCIAMRVLWDRLRTLPMQRSA